MVSTAKEKQNEGSRQYITAPQHDGKHMRLIISEPPWANGCQSLHHSAAPSWIIARRLTRANPEYLSPGYGTATRLQGWLTHAARNVSVGLTCYVNKSDVGAELCAERYPYADVIKVCVCVVALSLQTKGEGLVESGWFYDSNSNLCDQIVSQEVM